MTTKPQPKLARSVLEKSTGPFTFGMFLRASRTTLDMTQEEAATRLGATKSYICDIEKGRAVVTPATAVKYAKKLGFSVMVALEACLQDQLRRTGINLRVRLEKNG